MNALMSTAMTSAATIATAGTGRHPTIAASAALGWLIILLALFALALLLAYLLMYNRLVRERQEVASSWGTIEVELQRRYVLIPRLVESVKGAASHETAILTELSRRNAAAAQGGYQPAAVDQWEPPLLMAMRQVAALRERYPELNSQQNFLALQYELSITEDRLAAARRYYNLQVRQLNDVVSTFPRNVIAGIHDIRPGFYYRSAAG